MENSEPEPKFAHLGLLRSVKQMPEQKTLLNFDAEFTSHEFEKIVAGHFAQSMDEKWDFVFEDNWLYAFRSWTGNCIYQVRIEPNQENYRATETWVNRDLRQYNSGSDQYDLELLSWMINVFLLNKDAPFPSRPD